MENQQNNIKCFFGTQFGTELYTDGEFLPLFGSSAPKRMGFFEVEPMPDGRYRYISYLPVTEEQYADLEKMGLFRD